MSWDNLVCKMRVWISIFQFSFIVKFPVKLISNRRPIKSLLQCAKATIILHSIFLSKWPIPLNSTFLVTFCPYLRIFLNNVPLKTKFVTFIPLTINLLCAITTHGGRYLRCSYTLDLENFTGKVVRSDKKW